MLPRGATSIGIALLTLWGSGCTSLPGTAPDPRDPLESYNRDMHAFNVAVDQVLWKPMARGYRAITPGAVDRGLTNTFHNVSDLNSAINNLLQFKLSRFGSDMGRVATNSTVGLAGWFDVATSMGLPGYQEDCGQTLGYWGADPSPYLVLPILGPSTLRDALALPGDFLLDPFFRFRRQRTYWGAVTLRALDTRADRFAAQEFQEAAEDYRLVRDAHLQRRQRQIRDHPSRPGVPDAAMPGEGAETTERGGDSRFLGLPGEP